MERERGNLNNIGSHVEPGERKKKKHKTNNILVVIGRNYIVFFFFLFVVRSVKPRTVIIIRIIVRLSRIAPQLYIIHLYTD